MGRFMRPGGPIRELTARERLECAADVVVMFAIVLIGGLGGIRVAWTILKALGM